MVDTCTLWQPSGVILLFVSLTPKLALALRPSAVLCFHLSSSFRCRRLTWFRLFLVSSVLSLFAPLSIALRLFGNPPSQDLSSRHGLHALAQAQPHVSLWCSSTSPSASLIASCHRSSSLPPTQNLDDTLALFFASALVLVCFMLLTRSTSRRHSCSIESDVLGAALYLPTPSALSATPLLVLPSISSIYRQHTLLLVLL
jgi:hypothetical protein